MTIQEAIELLEEMKENCKTMPFEYRDEKATLKAEAIDTVLAELKKSKKKCKWKPKEKEEYWYRDVDGEIYSDFWSNHIYDEFRYNHAPVFKTCEECEQYWRFKDVVKEKSYEFNREEWEDNTVEKYFICHDFEEIYEDDKEFSIFADTGYKYLGTTYFKTEEDAQYIIDNFKEELKRYWL